jgi:hypothetical protein
MNCRIAHAAQIFAVVLALALVPAALAAKGGNGGKPGGGGGSSGSSITLAPLVYDTNANGLPNWGDTVTFNISTTATDRPYVNLQCFQNGILVAQGWNGFFDGALNTTRNFALNSGSWQSGAAECTAYLDMATSKGWQQLTSVSFHVDP